MRGNPSSTLDLRRARSHRWDRTDPERPTCSECAFVLTAVEPLNRVPDCPGFGYVLTRRSDPTPSPVAETLARIGALGEVRDEVSARLVRVAKDLGHDLDAWTDFASNVDGSGWRGLTTPEGVIRIAGTDLIVETIADGEGYPEVESVPLDWFDPAKREAVKQRVLDEAAARVRSRAQPPTQTPDW